MNHRTRRPTEPPIPQAEHFPKSYAAARRTAPPRFRLHVLIATGIAVLIVLIVAGTVAYLDRSAGRVADKHAVVLEPAAKPGPPVPQKPTEYSPPTPDELPGDGMWLVRKHITPGVYQSDSGSTCYWERLKGLSGKYVDLLDNGGFRKGPQLVEVLATDYAFSSQGCVKWTRVMDR